MIACHTPAEPPTPFPPGTIQLESLWDQDGDGHTREYDCDDYDPTVFPGAWDICADGRDNDCDGQPAGDCRYDGDYDLEQAHAIYRGEYRTDPKEVCAGTIATADLDHDGYGDLLVGFPGEDDAGAIHVFPGPIGGEHRLGRADVRITGEAGEVYGVGYRIEPTGDVDGDGHDDLATAWLGGISIVAGPFVSSQPMLDRELARLDFHFRVPFASVDDLDGDDRVDLIVADVFDRTYEDGQRTGTVFVFSGPTGAMDRNDAVLVLQAPHRGNLGQDVQAGHDLDGDGRDDLLVSGYEGGVIDGPPHGAGVLFVITEAPHGISLIDDVATSVLRGAAYQEKAGHALTEPADVDGDGYLDLLIESETGSWSEVGDPDQYVAASLVLGPVAGEMSLADADTRYYADEYWDGSEAVELADFDGDGAPDVIIGALGVYVGDEMRGAAHVYYDFQPGTWLLSEADARFLGTPWSFAGAWLDATDTNGDGVDDLVISGPYDDYWVSTEVGCGAVWVVLGGGDG